MKNIESTNILEKLESPEKELQKLHSQREDLVRQLSKIDGLIENTIQKILKKDSK